ncbi:hypothetical protein PAAG_08784 [Paracoccidioides lutzii Pb01]|uniref:Uncharacterized protein n=1 Tax=Paracoccidioides lutzii (strain ATCC MYA-826 / Pb01) TaxID=502779 RepID=C1HDE3_PARBA|nr:hypothetical protein PAAG_08784 [Paracoccidioides lutzii Pb01]EEH39515.2 hypothetical protein PAAG_08784 [Paracoccidioides lutzii Pb01]
MFIASMGSVSGCLALVANQEPVKATEQGSAKCMSKGRLEDVVALKYSLASDKVICKDISQSQGFLLFQ